MSMELLRNGGGRMLPSCNYMTRARPKGRGLVRRLWRDQQRLLANGLYAAGLSDPADQDIVSSARPEY